MISSLIGIEQEIGLRNNFYYDEEGEMGDLA
jgi:hypothetical protein